MQELQEIEDHQMRTNIVIIFSAEKLKKNVGKQ